jgi:glycosyltransferase involved in cell wall biosynthesis
MRLLFLTPYLPSPPRSGGPRRLHGLLSGLAGAHSVSVLSLVGPGDDRAAAVRATRDYCDEVVAIENNRYALPGRRKRALQLRSLLSPASYERLVYHRPALQDALDRMVERTRYDVITVEFAQMACYRLPRAATLVLDEHNVEYDILRRTWAGGAAPARKLYNYVDYLKLRREERAAWRRFDGCALTSARDERLLRDAYPHARTAVVPNAVDTSAFRPGPAPPEPLTLLFFGAIDYYPNTDGLLYFLDEVLPRIRARHPGVRLSIVGQSPPEAITRRAGGGVIVTGLVDDVRPYLERAAVVVAPLRVGGGTRLKIVEAMAMGKAIVSTTIGAEGIDVTDGRELLLADTAEAFAARVGRLLADAPLGRALGAAARRLAEERYSWLASVERLEGFYQELREAPLAGAVGRPPGRGAGALRTRAG